METNFKVGDKVRIRKDLKVGERYGGDTFVENMECMETKINIDDKITIIVNDSVKMENDELLARLVLALNERTKQVFALKKELDYYKECGNYTKNMFVVKK